MNRTDFRIILLLILVTVGSLGAADWYRSSPGGIPGAPIPGNGPEKNGWSLSIDFTEDAEIRSLYLDGILQGSTALLRNDGRLMAREERDSDGSIVSRVEYAYDATGNPRAVFINTESDTEVPVQVVTDLKVNADATVRRISSGSGGDWRISDLDESRNPVRQVSLESGALTEEITWLRDENGRLREEIRRNGDDVTRSRYDPDGRLIEENITRNNAIVRLRTYTWSGKELTRVEERGEGRLVVREMQWLNHRMTQEVRSVDGQKVSETLWSSADDKVETLYRDGEAVIRVYWSGNAKLREEFLKAGEVVRVREENR